MENHKKIVVDDKETFYKILIVKLEGLLSAETDSLANICNSAALLFTNLENINWAGFYIMKDGELVLGPFGGKTACTRIKMGKGVCGSAASDRRVYVVPNVLEFPGHIACDCDSRSEIVVPIIKDDVLYGVLDIDAPVFERFDDIDKTYLEKYVQKLNKYIKWDEFARV